MTTLRIGTRGSDLALWQTEWVSQRLRTAVPGIEITQTIIKTHGDVATQQRFDANWPVGGFVGALEQAIASQEVDLAVHSYKDLQTATTPGLIVAAVPEREVVHDTLVTRESVDLDDLSPGFRLGTSSPRRAAQFRQWANVEIVPIRGNVPTRVAKLDQDDLDGVVLAAAGLKRLSIDPPHRVELPTDRFVPAPAQGALALQTRDHGKAMEIVRTLDDARVRKPVTAERAFLRKVGAGCHVPIGALARLEGDEVVLHGQLFSNDAAMVAADVVRGTDPVELGESLAQQLLQRLE